MSAQQICVVCSGNICRSPFVERILRRELGKEFRVTSAGTLGIAEHPAYSECVLLAPAYGITLDGHRSRALTRKLVAASDLLLGMSREHADDLRDEFGAREAQIRLLGDYLPEGRLFDLGILGWVGRGDDLPDPVGLGAAELKPLLDVLELSAVAFSRSLGASGGDSC